MHASREDDRAAPDHRAPFALVGLDRELRVLEWNDRAEQRLGVARADALGRDVADLVPVHGGAAAWRALLVEADDAPPARLTLLDGRTWEWTLAPARVDGRVVGVFCYGADVTALAAAQHDSELEHVMLRVLVDNLPVVVCAYAPDGTYLYVEGKGLAGTPVRAAEMLGKNPLELFHDNADAVEFIRRGLAGQSTRMTFESFDRAWDSWHIPAPAGSRAALVSMSLDVTEAHRRERELVAKIELIERQQQVIRELSTPIIEVWEGVLVVPIVGLVDSARTSEILGDLLDSVGRLRARVAILDLTGIEVVDTATANSLLAMIAAVRLLGAEGILTGIHPNIARTIVGLGVDLRGIAVHANLRQALRRCLAADGA